MVTNQKGARRERELVNLIDGTSYAVMRAPASGAGTERELPDVLCGNGDDFYAIEAKSSGGDPTYVGKEEVEGLNYFSKNFGAESRIAVRFDYMDWYFFHPSEMYQTDAGSHRCKEATAEDGTHFDELFEVI